MTKTAFDGLQNVASGLGVGKSKRDNNVWTPAVLNEWASLENAYTSNWIAERICDTPAKDMTREWRTIKCDGAEQVQNLEDELCVVQNVTEALTWARLYGGGAIIMITDQDMSKPLDINKIKKGSLKNLLVFDRWDLGVFKLNTWDVLAPNYLKPESYSVRGGTLQVHHSHVVRFTGKLLPRRLQQQTQGWGDSALRRCIYDVTDMAAAKDGIAELMQEANIDIIKRDGLSEELATDQDDVIVKRYSLFSQMKSCVNMALLDGDETLERATLNLSGVAPMVEQLMVWISGASGIPYTKLFGISAQGLSATGEGDERVYNDTIRAEQVGNLSLSMRKLDEVLVRSALGKMPPQFDYMWNPLSQPNVVETEQASLLRAQRDRIYLEDQIVQPSQVMRNLQSNETYQFDDEILAEIEETEMSTEEYVANWGDDENTDNE